MTYIMVISPCDASFIGPFTVLAEAQARAAAIRHSGHDAYLMTPAEVVRNMLKFGRAPVELP